MEGLTQARGVSKEKAKEIALDALEKVGLKDKADYYPCLLYTSWNVTSLLYVNIFNKIIGA